MRSAYKVVRIACFDFFLIFCVFTVSSCGGSGLLPDLPNIAFGSVDGFVFVPYGSSAARAANQPVGYKPANEALVLLNCSGQSKTAQTDATGYFSIQTVIGESCALRIQISGYADKVYNQIAVYPNQTTRVGGADGVRMTPDEYGEIRVVANVSGGEIVIDGESTGIVMPDEMSYSFSYVAPGEHTVGISQSGYQQASTQTVNVTAGGLFEVTFIFLPPDVVPPVANAGEDGKWFAGFEYTLDGSGSYDIGGGSITYQWGQVSGPATEMSSINDVKPIFTPKEQGIYVFSLTVIDSANNHSNLDTVAIEVNELTGKIVFTASRGEGNKNIYTINANGTNLKKLTDNNYFDGWPKWSPDGGKILYTANPSDDELTFYVATMNADGTGINVTDTMGRTRDWSPDGSQILYEWSYLGTDQLYQSAPDATDKSLLTTTPRDKFFAAYSPDGTKIMFTVQVSYDGIEIVVMNRDGSDYRQLTNENKTHGYISWTPDGRILYTTADCIGCKSTLHVMNADGTGRQAWPMPVGVTDILSPIMTDDGRFIFYDDGEWGNNHICVMYSDGSAYTCLGTTGSQPDYHPGP
ncbi:MAG: translocation protein TolB [bacterium ADurb.Bin236]|nr:MAG: translocation protein TolB [bacterium ADurb.Bin236]